MKSTGEVMGIDRNLGLAYAKAQMAAQPALPSKGTPFRLRRRCPARRLPRWRPTC
jgi:hypothetical protein